MATTDVGGRGAPAAGPAPARCGAARADRRRWGAGGGGLVPYLFLAPT